MQGAVTIGKIKTNVDGTWVLKATRDCWEGVRLPGAMTMAVLPGKVDKPRAERKSPAGGRWRISDGGTS